MDSTLYNQMRREFRSEIKPFARNLHSNIPRGGSPLSGMSGSTRIARTTKTPDARSPYVWKLPSVKIDVGTGRRRRSSVKNIVRITFNDKRPFSAFSILETARRATGYRGANMLRGIRSKYPDKGKGRWVIQDFYTSRPYIVNVAERILTKYIRVVNRRVARRL